MTWLEDAAVSVQNDHDDDKRYLSATGTSSVNHNKRGQSVRGPFLLSDFFGRFVPPDFFLPLFHVLDKRTDSFRIAINSVRRALLDSNNLITALSPLLAGHF